VKIGLVKTCDNLPKDNPRLISSDYIYRKIHKNAKRQPLSKLFTGESASRKKNRLPKHSHTRTAQPTRWLLLKRH